MRLRRIERIERALLLLPFVLAMMATVPFPAQAQTIRILVQSSPLAGFQYHAGADFWDELKAGDRLELRREPDNPHDALAVRVEWQGRQLGYLPRAQNRAVAVEMDRGARVEARIARLRVHRNPWRRVLVEVWLVL
ncbi:HIRAN [Sterolibacterium denitrificans]|uniref:HIRAN n=2 Tax=Sterolibacterium denitrificans TaxID=157592 RepID=A0A7Z7MUA6_9PROT|nr:HIRAN [Sterolibacterium denitrificans]